MRSKRYEALSARLSALEERVNGLDVRADSHDADGVRDREDSRRAISELWAAIREERTALQKMRDFLMNQFSMRSVASMQAQISDLTNWRQEMQPLLNMIQWSQEKKGGE